MRIDFSTGYTLLDAADVQRIAGRGLTVDGSGYVQIYLGRERGRRQLHRFLLDEPDGFVDHINRIRHDNRRSNLRVVDRTLNAVNAIRDSSGSGERGVYPAISRKNPWQARITVNRKIIHLGVFPTVEAAAAARSDAELQYFGERCPR